MVGGARRLALDLCIVAMTIAALALPAAPAGDDVQAQGFEVLGPLPVRAVVPVVAGDGQQSVSEPAPPPPPALVVDHGGVQTLYLASAGVTNAPEIERRHTEHRDGAEYFQTPTHPAKVAWYDRFGGPGGGGTNTLFSAHVDFVGFGAGPFHGLVGSEIGASLYVMMVDGTEFPYTVVSVEVIDLQVLDMVEVVFPILDSHTERVTLISCGGTFVPYAGGGGAYNSRVILIAERWVP